MYTYILNKTLQINFRNSNIECLGSLVRLFLLYVSLYIYIFFLLYISPAKFISRTKAFSDQDREYVRYFNAEIEPKSLR